MLFVVSALLAIVVVAALVVAFVAYPQRGLAIPRAGWLSRALQGLVDRTGMDPDVDEAVDGGALTELGEQWRDQRREQRSVAHRG
ncbi:MAG: hypothetical protein H0U77_12040 [Nocardioidaceae bacterium]|nr:hypothetical protein [Nocardioidaceae bacterium]